MTTNGSNATASIRLGDGAGGFTGTTTVSTPSNPNAVAVGDFNGDGNQDIAVSSSNNAVAIRLGDGAGGFTGTTNITTGQTTKSIAVGDFNNDGKLDFVTADIGGDTATVALGNGAGGFPTVSSVSVGDGPGQVVVADFNNDGNLDFATSNQIYNAPNFGSPGTVTVRLGNGDGTFTNGPSYNVGDNPEYLAVGDFNEDGKPDLITSNQNSASLSLILGDVSNTATPPTTISVSSGPGEIRVADINNDGHQDVVFKRSGLENFAYLLGTGTGSFGTAVIVPVTGAAGTKLAVGDFNADGFQDFVTANFGTNTLFVRLGGCNVAPTITAVTPGVTISRQQGSAGTSDTIATVNDTETLKQNLTVAVMGTPPTGISVTSISAPDATTGAVTATIRAGCNAATGNNTVVLKVTDGNGATATANLTVTVSAATPPTPASAGSDQTFCNITTATLAANTPSVGTGAWSVVSGPSTSTAQFNSLTNLPRTSLRQEEQASTLCVDDHGYVPRPPMMSR
ncbi:MAG: VCBS repeat-containing protein [Blastocatellia bacterium]